MGRFAGQIAPRKGGYRLATMDIGEVRTFKPEDHGKASVRHLMRNISVSMHARRDMRFTAMALDSGVWVRRLA